MNKSDYINKANTLLKDTKTYQPLDTDASKTTFNRINMKLKQLKDKDKLEETNYKQFQATGSCDTYISAFFYNV
jgi:hypothetical protein